MGRLRTLLMLSVVATVGCSGALIDTTGEGWAVMKFNAAGSACLYDASFMGVNIGELTGGEYECRTEVTTPVRAVLIDANSVPVPE